MESRSAPSSQSVRDELEKILASAPFAASARSRRFLRYVVEGSLRSEEESFKEYAIAVEVFDRDSTYDPSVDAAVRVEAGRLRARLREYYDDIGRSDPILISIPKGGYRAAFETRAPALENAGPVPPVPAGHVVIASGRQHPLRLWASAASILVFIVMGAWGIYWNRHHGAARRVPGPIVIAVLPFANQTGVQTNSYLSEGLTDNLIRQLAELPQVRVLSREAVSGADPRKATKDLGVTVLLTGELQRNPAGRLVLNSELSNAGDGTVLKSSQFLPDQSDLRSVQADIVHDVIGALGLQLNSREATGALQPMTTSPAAFQDLLRGDSLMLQGDEASLNSAIQLFEDAVKKDNSFAQAFTSLAGAHLTIAIYFELPGEHVELARQYAERAITLDPNISEAHGVLGLVHLMFDWDFDAAQRELAVADRREDAIWHLGCTAHLLETNGNERHAEEDLDRMLEFDPGSVLLVSELGCVNYYAGRYDDSVRYYRQALATAPGSVVANWGLGRTLGSQGKYTEAVADLKRFNSVYGIEHPLTLAEIGYIQAVSGDRPAALETLHRLELKSRTQFVDPFFIAEIYLALNNRDEAFAWLEKAYKIRSPFLISLATDPKWSGVRRDPRLQLLWDRMTSHAPHENATGPQNSANHPQKALLAQPKHGRA
jgi:TolB-like protein/Tfp pilus assembly protein PilF